ncbi:MAG TPA: PIG-L family deacetylase [Thermoanaerobaculia bacterium]|nr:PIG-L family deacetylase [Thermoanaerobaculia bacterium]
MTRRLAPPGQTEEVRADRVLVIAPHYDDEAIGCGGLLAAVADSAARVVVLFLTDGGGGVEDRPGAEAEVTTEDYTQRRRAESEQALGVLGIEESRHLGLADGALSQHLRPLGAAYRDALEELEPDLVLVPGPLETTPDHQASFAALHDALAGLRRGDRLDSLLQSTLFLAYEVNHPGYPDLLVDVSAHLERIERALACYQSQLERHDYTAAALGLRRYRTHSLPPSVRGAEGYSRLRLSDFTTRSLSDLVAHLGGSSRLRPIEEGPLVSVIVRTRDRPQLLREALASLAASQYRRLQVVVVNDGGAPPELDSVLGSGSAGGGLEVERVDLAGNRGRAAAANAGVAAARGELVAFLDDDDLVSPEHFGTLVDLVSAAEVRAAYTDAAVGVYRLVGGEAEDGRGERGWVCQDRRLPYSRDFDFDLLLVDNYIPFNTLLVESELAERVGAFDESLPFFEDWDWLIRLGQLTTPRHLPRVTCEYRHFERSAHHVLGSADADRRRDFAELKASVLEKHGALLTPARLANAIVTLRREAVEAREEAAALRADRDSLAAQLADQAAKREKIQQRYFGLERAKAELEESWHRLNGEVIGLRAERAELLQGAAASSAANEALRQEEGRLRAAIQEQGEHQSRLYAEIERLNGLIGTMEQTRAWRLHQLLQRRRPAG